MNNQELELRVKELLEIENFFDMIIAVKDFEKEYKGSDFYKNTKMPLMEVIKNSKMWYLVNLSNIGEKIQNIIDGLDFNKINELLEQFGSVFAKENSETLETLQVFKDLVKK